MVSRAKWLTGFALFLAAPFALALPNDAIVDRSVELLGKLVEAKSISGCEDEAAAVIVERLKQVKLPYEIILSGDAPSEPRPPINDPRGKCLDGRQPSTINRPNILVRIKATRNPGQLKALMLMVHMDVVPAINQSWSPGIDPHKLTIKDGFIYGRGVFDMLGYLAISVEMMGEIQKSGVPLERDLILMVNSDEEKTGPNGAGWLTRNKPELFKDVELALSEGGSVSTDNQQNPLYVGYEAAQKRYQDFKLSAQGLSGHSSVPTKIQAANLVTEALIKMRSHQATPRLIPLIRTYFQERAKVESDRELKPILITLGSASKKDAENLYRRYRKQVDILEAKYPILHSFLRRTCTNTVLEAGNVSSKNAQPQTAIAYVNCRLMPDENVDDLLAELKNEINWSAGPGPTDPRVTISLDVDNRWNHADGSDMDGVFPRALKKQAGVFLKGLPVIPTMLAGATDLRYLRKMGIQGYGFAPIFMSEQDIKTAHGIDERIYVKNLVRGTELFASVVLEIVAPERK